MMRSLVRWSAVCVGAAIVGLTVRTSAEPERVDFGRFVERQLADHAEPLFGFHRPLGQSALGPYDGSDNLQAIVLAPGLRATLVSSSVASAADQIAMWPNDERPTHLFVCGEETSNPSVQRVDLSKPANTNATTIVTGLSSCDPVRRTAWGTIIVGEENGADGGLYEIINPLSITTPVAVTDRAAGITSDPLHVVKRKAVGLLSWEGIALAADGTMIYGDELAPSSGAPGGAIYKFVPAIPSPGWAPISVPAQSPLASGAVYGLRVAASGSSRWGQAAETGKGAWVPIDLAGAGVLDANGNIVLDNAQKLQKFTGYYRPEDMDVDPVALEDGVFRACWANTGRKSHTARSVVEDSAVQSEIMCLTEEPPSAAVPTPATGTIPVVDRFLTGSAERAMFDNVAFQPKTGNLVVLEDGSVDVVKKDGSKELRGNDLWICLPDGKDDDNLSDGCLRFASIRDTTAEPSGFIFTASGREAFVHIQHRAVNTALGAGNHGALIRISGFGAEHRYSRHDDRGRDRDDDHDEYFGDDR